MSVISDLSAINGIKEFVGGHKIPFVSISTRPLQSRFPCHAA